MTTLLQRAFDAASLLWPAEQDMLASHMPADLEASDGFAKAIAASSHKLVPQAVAALAEHRAGETSSERAALAPLARRGYINK